MDLSLVYMSKFICMLINQDKGWRCQNILECGMDGVIILGTMQMMERDVDKRN